MNELQIFTNEEFGEIRVIEIDNEPWFVGKDVVIALGYDLATGTSYTQYIKKYCSEEDVKNYNKKTQVYIALELDYKELGQRGGLLINEYALYDLVFESPLPQAKAFKSWVTHEVLPSIRKTGKYEIQMDSELPQLLNDMNQLVEDMKYKIEEQDKQIEEIKHLVGIRAKDVFDYGKIIKEHLGISKGAILWGIK